jgi:hypothetical protein
MIVERGQGAVRKRARQRQATSEAPIRQQLNNSPGRQIIRDSEGQHVTDAETAKDGLTNGATVIARQSVF